MTLRLGRQPPRPPATLAAQVADHFAAITAPLARKPVIIGHSFGGLLAQILAGRGLAAVTVAIDPAPFRGVLPLPISSLRSASAALGNPASWHRAVPLTYDQFRYAFANAVSEDEAKGLNASYKHQSHNKAVTEIVKIPGRGHALTIDSGWREVGDTALAFTRRFSELRPAGTGTTSS
jgi:non-heme chloroperoxidase